MDAATVPGQVHVRHLEELPRAIVAAGVLVGSGWVASRGVPATEEQIFEAINRLPSGLEPVLWLPMQLGSLFGPFVVGGLAWWRWRRWRPAVGSVVAGVVAWQLAKVVKNFVDRGRPLDEIEDVIRRMGTPTDGLGFVSGHSAVAFALATVVSPYLSRRARVGAFALAALVGLARIHVGAHLPMDVVGGASLGCLVGYLWRLAVGVPEHTAPPVTVVEP
jgi:glycosyltransferase 2 family protein